jgi:hypothetical protein
MSVSGHQLGISSSWFSDESSAVKMTYPDTYDIRKVTFVTAPEGRTVRGIGRNNDRSVIAQIWNECPCMTGRNDHNPWLSAGALAACRGRSGPPTYTAGGTVTGLAAGAALLLEKNTGFAL